MTNVLWSFALAGIGILGIYLAGRKNLWGWALGVFAQVLWIVFAIVTQQWGFILSALAYGWVYGLNWWKWNRDRKAHEFVKDRRARMLKAHGDG